MLRCRKFLPSFSRVSLLRKIRDSHLRFSSIAPKRILKKTHKCESFLIYWGERIRTSEWLDQNQLPYHLATPHYFVVIPFSGHFFIILAKILLSIFFLLFFINFVFLVYKRTFFFCVHYFNSIFQ